MFNTPRTIFFSAAIGAAALTGLSACGDDLDGSNASDSSTGRLRLLLTDAPLDGVEDVNVTFDSVAVSGSGGWMTVFSEELGQSVRSLQRPMSKLRAEGRVRCVGQRNMAATSRLSAGGREVDQDSVVFSMRLGGGAPSR